MKQPISILPAIALRGTTILQDMIVHFDVSRERSMKAIEAAMLQDEKIFLVTQKDPEMETPGITDLYKVGTVAYIKQVVKLPHDLLRVLVEGVERAELIGLEQEEPFLMAETAGFEADGAHYAKSLREAMYRSIRELFQRYCIDQQRSCCQDHEHPESGRTDLTGICEHPDHLPESAEDPGGSDTGRTV